MSTRWRSVSPYLLAGLLGGSGVLHFVSPGFFASIVPPALPGSQTAWVYASGAAELAVAASVANPGTRRLGGLAAAALFVGVFPANVYMALDWRDRSTVDQLIAWGRLPLQVPLVWWGWTVARQADDDLHVEGPGAVSV